MNYKFCITHSLSSFSFILSHFLLYLSLTSSLASFSLILCEVVNSFYTSSPALEGKFYNPWCHIHCEKNFPRIYDMISLLFRNHVVNSTRWQLFMRHFLTTLEVTTSNTCEECELQNLSCYSMDLSRIEWGEKKERLWQVLLRKFLPLSFTFSPRSLLTSFISRRFNIQVVCFFFCRSRSFFFKSSERVELFETFGPISILSSVSWDTKSSVHCQVFPLLRLPFVSFPFFIVIHLVCV